MLQSQSGSLTSSTWKVISSKTSYAVAIPIGFSDLFNPILTSIRGIKRVVAIPIGFSDLFNRFGMITSYNKKRGCNPNRVI